MSYEVTSDRFRNVPYVPQDESLWPELIESVDPLLRQPLEVSLSGVQIGLQQHENTGLLATALSEPLFTEEGWVSTGLSHELSRGWHPGPDHIEVAIAGLHTAAFCVQTSRLLQQYPMRNLDYTGQTGMDFVTREVSAPIRAGRETEAGSVLNTYPVRHVQIEVNRDKKSGILDEKRADVHAAASLVVPGRRELSTTSSLYTTILGSGGAEQQTVDAEVRRAERTGNFAKGGYYASFQDLGRYANVFAQMLKQPAVDLE
jgi:hypothetical protein